MKNKCGLKTEVYSRVVGYFRPVDGWNKGKQAEFKDRKEFKVDGGKSFDPGWRNSTNWPIQDKNIS